MPVRRISSPLLRGGLARASSEFGWRNVPKASQRQLIPEPSEKRVAKALKYVEPAWKGCCVGYERLRLNSEAV